MQTETDYQTSLCDQTLSLWRFPQQAKDSPLRAWDTADLLLLNHLKEAHKDGLNITVINDNFGAISCALLQNDYQVDFYSDSKVSELACQQNIAINQLNTSKIHFIQTLAQTQNIVLAKLPKNLAFLEYILQQCATQSKPHTSILMAAKASDINSSVIKLCQRYFQQVDVSLAWKKSRTIELSSPVVQPYSQFTYWQSSHKSTFNLASAPNVFARGKVDIGAAFFIPHLPDVTHKSVIDLACGNGILSLHLALTNPAKSMLLVDESRMAIESAQHNFAANSFNTEHVQFLQNDCLTDQTSNSTDVVICNPPFHQQKTITDHIAWQMFNDAKIALKTGGELRIVGNRHLAYHLKLNKLFGNCQTIAADNKFVVLSAIKT